MNVGAGRHSTLERVRAGVSAGLVAGVAFAAVMEADLTLSGNRLDDFRLLAQWGPAQDRWWVLGPLAHEVNSAALGGLYALLQPKLVGPSWARGLMFAVGENTLLWPLVLLIDRRHPAVADGDLATFARPAAFGWETLRHAAYGVVLGLIFDRTRRQADRRAE
jgi:hypothetical protein